MKIIHHFKNSTTYLLSNLNVLYFPLYIPIRTRRCFDIRFNVMDVVWTPKRRRVRTGILRPYHNGK